MNRLNFEKYIAQRKRIEVSPELVEKTMAVVTVERRRTSRRNCATSKRRKVMERYSQWWVPKKKVIAAVAACVVVCAAFALSGHRATFSSFPSSVTGEEKEASALSVPFREGAGMPSPGEAAECSFVANCEVVEEYPAEERQEEGRLLEAVVLSCAKGSLSVGETIEVFVPADFGRQEFGDGEALWFYMERSETIEDGFKLIYAKAQ